MRVEVLADQLIYTDKNNVRSDYVKGDIYDHEGIDLKQQLDAGNVKPAPEAASVSVPEKQVVVKPAPAPKPVGMEAK